MLMILLAALGGNFSFAQSGEVFTLGYKGALLKLHVLWGPSVQPFGVRAQLLESNVPSPQSTFEWPVNSLEPASIKVMASTASLEGGQVIEAYVAKALERSAAVQGPLLIEVPFLDGTSPAMTASAAVDAVQRFLETYSGSKEILIQVPRSLARPFIRAFSGLEQKYPAGNFEWVEMFMNTVNSMGFMDWSIRSQNYRALDIVIDRICEEAEKIARSVDNPKETVSPASERVALRSAARELSWEARELLLNDALEILNLLKNRAWGPRAVDPISELFRRFIAVKAIDKPARCAGVLSKADSKGRLLLPQSG